MERLKPKYALLPLLSLTAAAVLFGSLTALSGSISLSFSLIRFYGGIVCILSALLLSLSVCRSFSLKGFGFGLLTGPFLLLWIFCLRQGGFGILSLLLPVILLIWEMTAEGQPFTARNPAAVLLSGCGLIFLTGLFSVRLFPFSWKITLPDFDQSLLWQAAASAAAAAFLLLSRHCSRITHIGSVSAGQLFCLGCLLLTGWVLIDQAVCIPLQTLQLPRLLFFLSLLPLLCLLLPSALYGAEKCRPVQAGCAVLVLLPALRLTELFLSGSLPPEFIHTAGMLLLLLAPFTATGKWLGVRGRKKRKKRKKLSSRR